jgi:hypothetical protein
MEINFWKSKEKNYEISFLSSSIAQPILKINKDTQFFKINAFISLFKAMYIINPWDYKSKESSPSIT